MNDWELIQKKAKEIKCLTPPMNTWRSFDSNSIYKVYKIEEDKIIIERLTGGNNSELGKKQALNAIQLIKKQLRIKKSDWTNFNTTKLKALVEFHPNIKWDLSTHEVYWEESSPINHNVISKSNDITRIINDASDDELEKIQALVNKRKNQNKFRDNLLTIYGNKCAIAETGPERVLQAAHITNHAKSGINSNDNGLLLRADLHILFDAGLLLIHPKHLTIHLHTSLDNTCYSEYNGRRLAPRLDLTTPNKKYLLEKWRESDWAAPLD